MASLAGSLAGDRGDRASQISGYPTFASIDVPSGTEVGGTSVVATGTHLVGATVTVGGVDATVTANTPTTVTFTTPPNASALSSTAVDNARDVVVTTGQGSATLTGAYTYASELARILGSIYGDEYRANDPRMGLNGSAVSSWPSFASANALVQATAAQQPAFEAAGWNGGPSLLGDGVDDALIKTSAAGYVSGTRPFIFVAMHNLVAIGTAAVRFQLQSVTGNNNLVLTDAVTVRRITRDDDSGASASNNSATGLDTAKHLFRLGFTTGGTACLAIDGTGVINSTRTGALDEDMTQYSVFSDTGGNTNTNMRAVLALLLNDEPTAQNITDLTAAIKTTIPWIGYTANSLGLP